MTPDELTEIERNLGRPGLVEDQLRRLAAALRTAWAEVAEYRADANNTYEQYSSAVSSLVRTKAQLAAATQERDDLRRTNHRRLCGCEESAGVFGCGVPCACRCHVLEQERDDWKNTAASSNQRYLSAMDDLDAMTQQRDDLQALLETSRRLDESARKTKELRERLDSLKPEPTVDARRMDTPDNRDFWDHVARLRKNITTWPKWKQGWQLGPVPGRKP